MLADRERPAARQIDGIARQRIKSGVTKAGYTLAHFNFAAPWNTLKKLNTPVGLLIKFAEEFGERVDGVKWPKCFHCEDTGEVIEPGSPWDSKGPCCCAAGEQLKQARFPDFDRWKSTVAAGIPWCTNCSNTGMESRLDMCCHKCQLGKRLEAEERARRDQEEAKRREEIQSKKQQLADQHICPRCEGWRDHGGRYCDTCRGTGEYWSPEEWKSKGNCFVCCGTGRISAMTCKRCSGTGREDAVKLGYVPGPIEEVARRRYRFVA